MRFPIVAALLLLPVAAAAQSQAPGTTTIGPVQPRLPTTTPAPVPDIPPPAARGLTNSVPEKLAPPGVGSTGVGGNDAGPANAAPFSGAPPDPPR
jgi:hypothetical protein